MRHDLLHFPPMGVLIYAGWLLVPLMWATENRYPIIVVACFIAAIFLAGTFGVVSASHMSQCAGTKEGGE